MLTTNQIHKLLGVEEVYKAPDTLMKIILDKEKREDLFRQFLKYETDVSYDWFMQYFEEEQADRKNKKQDFTPKSVSTLLSKIISGIFYLDPPYENTTQKSYKGDFNSQAFYDWAFGMSKNNIVLISSYDISDERFECVYEFKTARSTMQGGGAGKRTEKLFMAVIT
ncbi:TPA: hypothetical protein ACP0QF_001109 [Streptococcus pyogenes]